MEQTTVTHPFLAAILSGDRTLLPQLYRELFPMVNKMVWENGGTEDDAKDVFQDALMVVYARAKQPGFQLVSQFSTFFYGVAFNQWRSRRKKKQYSEVRIAEGMEYTADGQPEFDHHRLERQKLFDKAFAQLGADCRELLLLFFQKTPMEEIARQMGYGSKEYAAKRKHGCKERLIELIKNYPEYRELLNT
jgi:RNA polymerase sigma factor (sigma-70 family)